MSVVVCYLSVNLLTCRWSTFYFANGHVADKASSGLKALKTTATSLQNPSIDVANEAYLLQLQVKQMMRVFGDNLEILFHISPWKSYVIMRFWCKAILMSTRDSNEYPQHKGSYMSGHLIWNLLNELCNFSILRAFGEQNTEITQQNRAPSWLLHVLTNGLIQIVMRLVS